MVVMMMMMLELRYQVVHFQCQSDTCCYPDTYSISPCCWSAYKTASCSCRIDNI